MRLTRHTDYSLRLLMLLAIEPDQIHTVDEVAQRYGVSRDHLMKVAQTLIRAGFVDSARGRGGGLRLRRPSDKINLGAVIRATEQSLDLVECFNSDGNACVVTPACGLREPLRKALQAFLHVLDGYSLANIVGSRAASGHMRRLLGGSRFSEARP
jgi:Rrf2 family nitric oxide-sensitive transcriptional repressor